jgi:glutathione S-transferase
VAVILWHIEVSHFNEKARWALDYKGIRYERRVPMPGLHGVRALVETRGAQRRLPVVELDGRRVGDSTAIIAALEEHTPEPPLYPADAGERARALELEDFFDEHLGPQLRRFSWHHTLQDPDAVARTLFAGGDPTRERLLRRSYPVANFFVRRDYRVTEESAREARAEVVAAMDRLEAELGPSGYLVGDRFSVADLAAASLFTPVVTPPERPFLPKGEVVPAVQELSDELTARPGGQWIYDMYARHRGAYAGEAHPVSA